MTSKSLSNPRSLLVLALALAGAACSGSDGMLAPNHGRVRFVLGSGDGVAAVGAPTEVGAAGGVIAASGDGEGPSEPRRHIKSANVTFASILARNLDGVLENVDIDLPATVDVVTLETGRRIQLPEGVLPEGTYDQVVVVMTEVQIVLADDTEITINPPGGGWTAIAPLCPPVEVTDGGEATVSLAIEVRNAFLFDGGRFHFTPRFRRPFGCAPVPEPNVE